MTVDVVRHSDIINVTLYPYGAVGDDTTDDTTALQSAFNAASTNDAKHIYIPEGTYKITSALNIPLSYGMKISGGGKLVSQIKQYTANTPILRSAEDGNHSITIEDLGLVYNSQQSSANTDSYAIQFDHGASYSTQWGWVLQRLWIEKAHIGIGIKGTAAQQLPVWGTLVADSVIKHSSKSGIYWVSPTAVGMPNVTFRNLYIYNTGGGPTPVGEAITTNAVDELRIEHCDFEGWTRKVVYCDGHTTPVVMTGCHFENNTFTDTGAVEYCAQFVDGGAIVDGCTFSGSITKGAQTLRVVAQGNAGILIVRGCGFNITINSGSVAAMDVSSTGALYTHGNRQIQAVTYWPVDLSVAGRSDLVKQHDSTVKKPGPSADKGNAAATLIWLTDPEVNVWNTPITADRAVTLTTTGTPAGARFRIVRTAACTGAFNINVGTGPLKALGAAGTWCDVEFNGATSAWMLVAAGTL